MARVAIAKEWIEVALTQKNGRHDPQFAAWFACQIREIVKEADGLVSAGFGAEVHKIYDMPKIPRKQLSYNGAVRSRDGDPVHWTDEHGRGYYDASNKVYHRVLEIVLLGCDYRLDLQTAGINENTSGDLIECVLAKAYFDEVNWAWARDPLENMCHILETLNATYRLTARWTEWHKMDNREMAMLLDDIRVVFARRGSTTACA